MLAFQVLALASLGSVIRQSMTPRSSTTYLDCPCSFDEAFHLDRKVNASRIESAAHDKDLDCCHQKLFRLAKMDKLFTFMFIAGLRSCVSSPILRSGKPVPTTQATSPTADGDLLRMYGVFPSDCGIPQYPPRDNRAFPRPRGGRVKRVVGGEAAKSGQFPWQVALLFKGQQYCGGAVVHRNWVVTASHCFNPYTSSDPRDWTVTIGEHDLHNREGYEQISGVKNITKHQRYKSMWFEGITDTPPEFDIAVVELKRPVEFNMSAQPVCVMKPDTTFSWGTKCYISGWGHINWNGSQPSVLNYVMVPIVSHAQCNKPKSYNGTIHDTALCAGYQEGLKDSCEFDSGGPLVCIKNGRYYAVGLVSWGYECARPHKYGVYSRMEKLTPWMVKHIAAKETVVKKTVRKGSFNTIKNGGFRVASPLSHPGPS